MDFSVCLLVALYPAQAKRKRVRLAPNQSLLRGTILAENVSRPGQFVPYRAAGPAGTGTAKLILEADCATDAVGNIYLGTLATTENTLGITFTDTDCFVAGTFRTTELIGLDLQAVHQLGRLIEGTLADGILVMP